MQRKMHHKIKHDTRTKTARQRGGKGTRPGTKRASQNIHILKGLKWVPVNGAQSIKELFPDLGVIFSGPGPFLIKYNVP